MRSRSPISGSTHGRILTIQRGIVTDGVTGSTGKLTNSIWCTDTETTMVGNVHATRLGE